MLKKNFVIFVSPGTFFPETSEMPIDSWDIAEACELAHTVTQRWGATPYSFVFVTRGRKDDELDSKEIARSPNYFLGGKVETIEEVFERNDPKEDILRSNMKNNDIKRILVNTNSYKSILPLREGDIVLDWKPRPKKKVTKAQIEAAVDEIVSKRKA